MILKRFCPSAQSSVFRRLCLRQFLEASTAGRSSRCLRFSSTLASTNEDTEGTSSSSRYVSTVFGATGFLGRYVVRQLVEMGSQVIVPYRGSDDGCKHLKLIGDSGQVVPLRYDIRDEDSIKAAMAGSNVVVNLIGRDYESHSFGFEELNVWIPERISRLVDDHGSIGRYIHVSALGACPEHPSAQYKTKAEGEDITRQNFPEATILRPAHMFGTEDRLLNTWATFAKKMPVVPIIGDGSNKFQPAHVADVAAAIVGAVTDGSSIGKTFELGGPDVYTVNELVALVFEVIRGEPRILHIPFDTARLISKETIGDDLLKSIRFPTAKLIMFSRNNIRSLRKHYMVSRGALTFKDLGVNPRKMDGEAIEYLSKYRKDRESSAATVGVQTTGSGVKTS